MPIDDDLLRSLRHDVRVPFSTLAGVISALQEEPDMDEAERAEFLEILKNETATCQALADDLLSWKGIPHAVPSPDQRTCSAQLVEALRPPAGAQGPADFLSVDQSEDSQLEGGFDAWLELAKKLRDHGHAHALPGTPIYLLFGPDGCVLRYSGKLWSDREIRTLGRRLPQRARRVQHIPKLGMGLFLAAEIGSSLGYCLRASQTPQGQRVIRIERAP